MILIVTSLILISIIFAILGTVSLWKNYVYYADALAHSSFLALVVGSALSLSLNWSGLLITLIFALSVFQLKKFSQASQSIIITANIMLAAALVISDLIQGRFSITDFFFGDIIAVNFQDLYIIIFLFISVIIFAYLFYEQIAVTALNKDLAKVYGINVNRIELIYLIIFSFAVFIGIKIVGVMLITSILLIPGMSAKLIIKTPAQMIFFSIVISLFNSLLALVIAFYLDMQLSPLIMIIGALNYLILKLLYGRCALRRR